MKTVLQSETCSVYSVDGPDLRVLLASTPESRRICNDPLLYGVNYTEALKAACARVLPHVGQDLEENQTSVVHLLRGGLNFGLREALALAFDWNAHSSTFLSAQRRRKDSNPQEWEIGECDYRKLAVPAKVCLVMGDVVASGVSLQYGIESMLQAISEQKKSLRSILFFTIGGPRTEEVFRALDGRIRTEHPEYEGTTVVYFEGRFPVAGLQTTLSIKITGTDLLRHGQDLTPEFVNSQYESPMFPVERCTIYDAGSRAFEPDVYLQDVVEYWESVSKLSGLSYQDYLKERFPGLDAKRFTGVDSLKALAEQQLDRLRACL